jgi:hypothetical protein
MSSVSSTADATDLDRRSRFYASGGDRTRALRTELEAHRDLGHPFATAWPPAVRAALDGLMSPEAAFWRGVFTRQRGVWAACYSDDACAHNGLRVLYREFAEPPLRSGRGAQLVA